MGGRQMAKMSPWETNWRSSFRGNHIFTADFVSSSRLSAQSHVTIRDIQPVVGSPSNSPPNYTYQFNSTMAVVILVIASAFLLFAIMLYYIRKCFSRPGVPTRPLAGDRAPGQKNDGLDREVIETFPVVAYSAASMAKNSTECAVCLAEFQEDEKTRLLPKCNHAFHPECIDMWLCSHSTCPLCRISLITESHSIAIDSNTLQDSASQANLDGAAPVIQEELEASSERDLRPSSGVERAGEREAVLALSRSSRSFRQAAQEVENRERPAATSATYLAPNTVDERTTSSRWISKLRRSCSMEVFRSSAKVESPDSSAESLITEDKERNDPLPREENGVTTAAKGTSSFYFRSRSERIAQISTPAEQTEVIIASESKEVSEQ
ncbi:hypothetical protein O6H91_13G053400 [Diphasiastrum complanatum]|uniref:Uncharacterized protein n=1 Tax=Diphasiastrum complanatum TaxID=34168 RepID=A0ACC2BUR7_DIPCM|nr:hypothetical protein O6H91_13G053400 [Diphasiastrum complanatum]